MKRKVSLVLWLLMWLPLEAQYQVEHLERPYNTAGSETGALRVGDTVLVYSSMQTPTGKRNSQFSFGGALTQVYQARVSRSGKLGKPRPCRWGINSKRDHTSNVAVDPLTHDLYFTRCPLDDKNLRCDIWWARRLKRAWDTPQRLAGPVNRHDCTATQPTVARLDDTTAILYFASDRAGGMGGMDIWYTLVRNGIAAEPVNLGPQVNSTADDITPYYDPVCGVLYFSSNRPGGQGGHDIYCAVGSRNVWQAAEAVCHCLNSAQNDIYFTVSDHDTKGIPTAGHLASNREDSYYLSDSMCCNDIYRWTKMPEDDDTIRQQADESTAPAASSGGIGGEITSHSESPLFLYFHNDEPDPGSRSATTEVSYNDCQRHYASLREEYLKHQTTAEDSALIQRFFDTCVEGNYRRVEELMDEVEERLDEGRRVVITVAGYASPLYRSEYNQTLSERRIEAFVNMLREWRGGVLSRALDNGQLVVERRAHGAVEITSLEHPALPAPGLRDGVYGLPAAMARRIEILLH